MSTRLFDVKFVLTINVACPISGCLISSSLPLALGLSGSGSLIQDHLDHMHQRNRLTHSDHRSIGFFDAL